jgi:hypothetical protein
VAARPATTFVCQFCPPGSGSGSATLGLICISICVAAGGRSLHMLKKARRNWRWRPAQPLLLCVSFALMDPDPQRWALLVFLPAFAAGGRSLHMLKKARRNWRWRPAQPLLCVSILPSWIRIRIRNTGPYLYFYLRLQRGAAACTC